jgi:polysaccharide pyruvyl transferase WcaK-like protein
MTIRKSTNILISSTRQWNPGDEFIRKAVKKLVEESTGWEINWVLYDRNPDIRNCRLPNISNSFFNSNVPFIDFVVLSGSPEWNGPMMTGLYRYAFKFGIPVVGIGLGGSEGDQPRLNKLEKLVLSAPTTRIIVRDKNAQKYLSSYNIGSILMPGPTVLASPTQFFPSTIKSIGIVWQVDNGAQASSLGGLPTLINIIDKLKNGGFEVSLICHYISELEQFNFVEIDKYYSYDPDKYLDIYAKFDLIIGLRLHGCILGLSLGKPAINIPHDSRTLSGANEIPIMQIAQIENIMEKIQAIKDSLANWENKHTEFLKSLKQSYLDILQTFFCSSQSVE